MARKPKASSGGTPATVALTRAGVAHDLHPYDHEAGPPGGHASYGLEAVAALGLDAGQVFKTLVARVDGRLVVAVVPASALRSRVPLTGTTATTSRPSTRATSVLNTCLASSPSAATASSP